MNFDNIINGIARPLIGFFMGMALAYTFRLAQSAGWIFAVGWFVVLCLIFGLVVLLDRFLDWGFDRLTGLGVKSNGRTAGKAEGPHWFVRFGWIISMTVGFGAAFLLPDGVQEWIIAE
ncbi:hypothetical protein [Yoonia sp.]|uniref:hypothetical protein n=1 Tax=Yoonia sp. TaxID=2212373 RepID=UPI003974990C